MSFIGSNDGAFSSQTSIPTSAANIVDIIGMEMTGTSINWLSSNDYPPMKI